MNTSRHKLLLDEVEGMLGTRKRWLTVPEFAQITGLHPQTVRMACARGELPATQQRKGGHYRIHYTQLEDYFKEYAA